MTREFSRKKETTALNPTANHSSQTPRFMDNRISTQQSLQLKNILATSPRHTSHFNLVQLMHLSSTPSSQPIQCQKITLPDGITIETDDLCLSSLQDLLMNMRLTENGIISDQLQQAISARKKRKREDNDDDEYESLKKKLATGEDYQESDEDSEYSELIGQSSGMRLMKPGFKKALARHKDRTKPGKLPINSLKGDMFELAFNKLKKEGGQEFIDTNSYVMNCPGIDHISPFGDRMFHQSKNFTAGSAQSNLNAYESVMESSADDGSLLLNKGSQKGKVGSGIRSLFEQANTQFPDFNMIIDKSLTEMTHTFNADEQPDYDSAHPTIEEFKAQYYMQLPSDVWDQEFFKQIGNPEDEMMFPSISTRAHPHGELVELDDKHEDAIPEMDMYYPQELTTEQMMLFDQYMQSTGIGSTATDFKKEKKKNEDTDYKA